MSRNKEKLINTYSEDYVQTPEGDKMFNPITDKVLRYKLEKAEELFKNIYQWLISNDSLEEEDEEQYAIRVINEIPHLKEDINKFFRDII